MRIPPRYEEMISDLIGTAGKYGFYFEYDTLADYPPGLPETGHDFRVCVHLRRTQGDFIEDAPVPI
jgi:hypothetical protein